MSRAASRRDVLKAGAAGGLALALPAGAHAAGAESHGLSTFGDLKYPPDFQAFDYVNVDAPKGGRLVTVASQWMTNQNPQTFNSLNTWILKGDAPPVLDSTFATLMVRALDEPDAIYGLAARSVSVSDDRNVLTFRLRPNLTFHDGSPLTAEDVAWSFTTLKAEGHPSISQTIRDMVSAEATAPDTIVVTLSGRQSRGLPAIIATLPILSKAYYATRTFDQTTLEPPLGSGAYKVGRFEAGRYIEYQRVANWWGHDLPVQRGQNNFEIIRIEFYRDRTVAFEAFKAGEYLVHEEFTSRFWATGYDFPALRDGRVKRFELEDRSPSGAQGWYFNLRRPQFKDARVREALGLVFDFEWTNRNIFYGSYLRTQSPFVNSEFEATGRPSADELVLLEPFRGKVPDAVFGPVWTTPTTDGTGRDRDNLRRAVDLLAAAGWRSRDQLLRNAAGETLKVEFLDNSRSFEPIIGPYLENLKRIGVAAEFRIVDASQYQKRKDDFDFDVVSLRSSMPPTPDESLRQFWHSDQADVPGSSNLAGVRDPVIDALLEKALTARSRAELVAICRALDRVFRFGHYWVPQWYKPSHWIAEWDVYERPRVKPRYARGIQQTWWVDMAKAKALGKGL